MASPSTTATPSPQSVSQDSPPELGRDLVDYLTAYAKDHPEVAALWCFGIGFIVGWKLKPW